MDICELIDGNDTVDPEVNLEKIKLLDEAISLYFTAGLQQIYAQKNKTSSNFKKIASEIINGSAVDPDVLLPLKKHYSSDPVFCQYSDRLLITANDDVFALQALQEMASLDFECRHIEPIANGFLHRFERIVTFGGVLYRLFAKLIPQKAYKNLNGMRLQRLDLSLSKIVFAAGQMGAISVERLIQHDSNIKHGNGMAEKKEERKKKAVALFDELFGKSLQGRKKTDIARAIIKKWGAEDVPSIDTVIRYLKKEGLV